MLRDPRERERERREREKCSEFIDNKEKEFKSESICTAQIRKELVPGSGHNQRELSKGNSTDEIRFGNFVQPT